MPSKDDFHAKHPELNEWMQDRRVARRDRPQMSSQLVRISEWLGVKPEELVEKIPADTARRLKYPVLETENPDGSRSYKHDLSIVDDALMSSLRV